MRTPITVIESCTTMGQLSTAHSYSKLWLKRYCLSMRGSTARLIHYALVMKAIVLIPVLPRRKETGFYIEENPDGSFSYRREEKNI